MVPMLLRTASSQHRRTIVSLARKGLQNRERAWNPIATRHAQRHSLSSTSTSPSPSSPTFPTTPDVCDDFADTVRVVDPSLGFRSFGSRSKFGGRAVTVKCHEDNSVVKHLAKNVDGTGKIIVVDGGGSKRRALLGDMVAADCIQQGWEGLVIYGCVRDVDEIAALPNLGVQALGSHPIPTTKRQEGQIDVPVTFGGVTIAPGDWIVCDNNGIVVTASDPREVPPVELSVTATGSEKNENEDEDSKHDAFPHLYS